MKKLVLALYIVLILLLVSACSGNSTPKDYNDLTEAQKVMMGEISADLKSSLTKISFNDSSNVATTPTGMSAYSNITLNGNSGGTTTLKINYKSYVGDINGYTITGTVVVKSNYDDAYDNYASSETAAINLIASKNGVNHSVSSTYEGTRDKNTGVGKSYSETGSFDGAGYRESK